MDNIGLIDGFINNKAEKKLLINQVNDEIGLFYVNLIENYTREKNIKLVRKETFSEDAVNDLFAEEVIDVCFSNNKGTVENFIRSNNKCIIFSDYKNYKVFSDICLCINGYNYQKDINIYLKRILKVNNSEILDFCLYVPYLTFSELSKYFINESKYVRDKKIKESSNSILEIRKSIYNQKKNQKDMIKIYTLLKKEALIKKFSFLTS